ncbi:hypothetical protein IAU60_003320 [Kwoniella sp. DSM 27419]
MPVATEPYTLSSTTVMVEVTVPTQITLTASALDGAPLCRLPNEDSDAASLYSDISTTPLESDIDPSITLMAMADVDDKNSATSTDPARFKTPLSKIPVKPNPIRVSKEVSKVTSNNKTNNKVKGNSLQAPLPEFGNNSHNCNLPGAKHKPKKWTVKFPKRNPEFLIAHNSASVAQTSRYKADLIYTHFGFAPHRGDEIAPVLMIWRGGSVLVIRGRYTTRLLRHARVTYQDIMWAMQNREK